MNFNKSDEILLGRFDGGVGQIFLLNQKDRLSEETTELHESIHAQLFNMSTHGGLISILFKYSHYTSGEHGKFINEIVDILFESQRYVQEVVATTASALFLESEGYLSTHNIADFIAPSYLKFLNPLCQYRNTFFHDKVNILEGTINLGLATLCSPIIEFFNELNASIDIEDMKNLLNRPDISPSARLIQILGYLAENGYTASDFHPQGNFASAKEGLAKNGISIIERSSPEEAKRAFDTFLASPLIQADPNAAKCFSEKITLSYEPLQLESSMKTISAFLNRSFGVAYCQPEAFAEYFKNLTGFASKLQADNYRTILELRAEDIVPDPEGSSGYVRLVDGLRLCHLFPLSGDYERRASAILPTEQIEYYWDKAETTGFLVLLDSAGYDFMRGKWFGKKAKHDHFVVIPLGSIALVDRVLLLHPFKKKVLFSIIQNDDPRITIMVLRLFYIAPMRYCYTIVPCSENLGAYLWEHLVNKGIEFCPDERVKQEFPLDFISTIVEHIGSVGWATGNVADENPNALVPLFR
jgi:hypothetical protein